MYVRRYLYICLYYIYVYLYEIGKACMRASTGLCAKHEIIIQNNNYYHYYCFLLLLTYYIL